VRSERADGIPSALSVYRIQEFLRRDTEGM
jgi:hypothetical protein